VKIFVSRLLPQESLQPILDAGWSVDMYANDSSCPREEFLRRCENADALLVQGTDSIDAKVFDNSTCLKVISCCSIGYDNVDLATAEARGVIVCNSPAHDLIATTAEAAVALLLGVAKRITRLHIGQQKQQLPPYSFVKPMGLPIRNKVSGIIGLGRIGAEIARIMQRGFENSILYFNRSRKSGLEQSIGAQRLELDELLCASDFVFVTLPLTDETRNLITAQHLDKMKRDAVIVNIARAGIIDDSALADSLSRDRIFGAGLDVYDSAAEICGHPNLILTAHMAAGETQACRALLELAVDSIVAVLNGKLPESVVTT
jgi:lactate dehydrogenase-like 2-hydroxyacid dehydrogenase